MDPFRRSCKVTPLKVEYLIKMRVLKISHIPRVLEFIVVRWIVLNRRDAGCGRGAVDETSYKISREGRVDPASHRTG